MGASTQTRRERSRSGLPRSCSACCCLLLYEVISGRIRILRLNLRTHVFYIPLREIVVGFNLNPGMCWGWTLKPSRNSRLDSLPALDSHHSTDCVLATGS
jgi:hypothetical protein